ncbi:hypothetical protein QTP70_034651, partial [Hemibagrus guttatus]
MKCFTGKMQWLTIYVFLLDFGHHFFRKVTGSASEFRLQGDYLLGGLFSLNTVYPPVCQTYPVALECYKYQFDESSYQMFEMMRFTVEEINNSSTLLPNVSLGYEIFDHCSNLQNFPSVLSFISENGSIPVQRYFNKYKPKIVAVVGPYGSTSTISVAPLFTLDLIPMLLKEIKKLDFYLNSRKIKYDQNGDPYVFYDVVFWRLEASPPVFERIGTYSSYPEMTFSINSSLIGWDNDTSVPFANCSVECNAGFRRERDQNHACCFQCMMCEENTYINYT